jgi:hypothetical protein
MSNGARRAPQLINIDLAVLPVATCQGHFYYLHEKSSILKLFEL